MHALWVLHSGAPVPVLEGVLPVFRDGAPHLHCLLVLRDPPVHFGGSVVSHMPILHSSPISARSAPSPDLCPLLLVRCCPSVEDAIVEQRGLQLYMLSSTLRPAVADATRPTVFLKRVISAEMTLVTNTEGLVGNDWTQCAAPHVRL